VSLALRDALFEEGRDISCPDVLINVANAHGVSYASPEDARAVRAEWHDGESRGVKGSPHFHSRDVNALCPSLDISKDRQGQVDLRRDTKALDTFLAEFFEGLSGGGDTQLGEAAHPIVPATGRDKTATY
jgi:hypothetical protein